MAHDFGGEPIRRVVLAQAVPLLTVDQRFIENLENVALDLVEAEAPDMRKNAPDQRFAIWLCDDPIEKIALRSAENARRLEGGSRQHTFRVVVAQAEHRQRNGLCHD